MTSFVKLAKRLAFTARVRFFDIGVVVFTPLCAGTLNVCMCKEGPRGPLAPVIPGVPGVPVKPWGPVRPGVP